MARKSRRTDAPVAPAPEPKSKVCRLGVYTRTSKSYNDDGCSIANQQRIVADHVARLGDAVVAGYYTDDGFTGTNQDRDAFQQMLEDLRAGGRITHRAQQWQAPVGSSDPQASADFSRYIRAGLR